MPDVLLKWMAALAALVLVAFLLAPSWGFLDKADFVAAGVCHRLPEHSLFFGERQSPLCARCTGNYVGLAVTAAYLAARRRLRSGGFPPARVLAVLALFAGFWAVDGLNSYVSLMWGRRLLYRPSNLLRLLSGGAMGMAWGLLAVPFFNRVAFESPSPRRVVDGFAELFPMVVLTLAALAPLYRRWPVLLYPLALLSLAGPLMLLGAILAAILGLLLRAVPVAQGQERRLLLLWLVGMTVALAGVALMNLLRHLAGV